MDNNGCAEDLAFMAWVRQAVTATLTVQLRFAVGWQRVMIERELGKRARSEKMKQEDLRIWTDGTEAYVAETIDAAMRMQRELMGSNPCDVDEWYEDERDVLGLVDYDTSGVEKKTTKRREDWIAENGPGFLYSSEY